MQTLQIILTLAAIAAYMAMGFLAAFAFVRLKRQEKWIRDIHHDTHQALMLTLGIHMRRNFDDLKEMQRTLQRFVADERYERAKELKTIIARREAEIEHEIQNIKEIYGDAVDIKKVEI